MVFCFEKFFGGTGILPVPPIFFPAFQVGRRRLINRLEKFILVPNL
jgi:hypothetical protein